MDDDLDYLRSEAERLPNGTAAKALRMMQPDTVTITISAKHAWRICGYLSGWEANDDWTRDAYEEFRAALEGER